MEVAVLGGGAAGFFAAISCRYHHPDAQVTLYEKSDKLLAKVKVSGGGRCNVTHACFSITQLVKNYPRGGKELRKAFEIFSTNDTVNWFEHHGVQLKTEPDGRMFPITDNSQTIIDCLVGKARNAGVRVLSRSAVKHMDRHGVGFNLILTDGSDQYADKVIIATGGSPKPEGFEWLHDMGHAIEYPVPSLFTFNIPNNPITSLMGITVENASVWIEKTKLRQQGPVLITHWGLSGPAVLKLSAFGARVLHELKYNFRVHVNWLGDLNEEQVRAMFSDEIEKAHLKKLKNSRLFDLPSRLWNFLLVQVGVAQDTRWSELKKEHRNRLIKFLTNHEFDVSGKTTFKEEFVTCGGVSLKDVDMQTMESKVCPGMYFAGEVLDIDGVTGGFNFQAAWTTGFLAGRLG